MALVKRIILALGFGGEIYSQLLMLVVSVPLSLLVARFSYELIELRLTRWLRSTQWRPRPSLS
jgi:peptidoglycan/LPS O-acetylase OafA/YrhL